MPCFASFTHTAKCLLSLLTVVCLALAGLLTFGNKQQVPSRIAYTPNQLPNNLDDYLKNQESQVPNLKPNNHKQIVWANEDRHKTPVAIVYIHGFSSSLGELRPVPDQIAQHLNANLYFTRLTGHGRTDDAMGDVHVSQWLNDLSEAIAIGSKLGDQIVIMGTSTGGTLASMIPLYPRLEQAVDAIVFVSPNFGTQNRLANIAAYGGAKHWLTFVAGKSIVWPPLNDAHAQYWTLAYPPSALIPMMSLINTANAADYSQTQIPALFIFSEHDAVVRPENTHAIVKRWGTEDLTRVYHPQLTANDDADAHVVAGDIRSPAQNAAMIQIVTDWLQERLNKNSRQSKADINTTP